MRVLGTLGRAWRFTVGTAFPVPTISSPNRKLPRLFTSTSSLSLILGYESHLEVLPSSASPSLSGSHHPFCFSAAMGKHGKSKKPENLGKGKVTPVQIAFIVDRYLADNNYTNTLSTFRVEASDLLSKTKGKEAPKGLMGLGEILDEYISLKEQRVMVDQEKRRVEMALGGIQDVMRVYYSVGGIPLPSSPPLLPPQFLGTPTAPVFPASNPNYGSPPGTMSGYSSFESFSLVIIRYLG